METNSVMVNRKINKRALLKKLGIHLANAHIFAGSLGILLSILEPRFSLSEIVMYAVFMLGGISYKKFFN